MSEENPPETLPEEDMHVITDDDPDILDESTADVPFIPGRPDDYPGAAETDPDRWQEDPLLQSEIDDDDEQEELLSDQILRDESLEARWERGDEQIPPDEPTLGEAAADVDFGVGEDDDYDSSDDPANSGGSPLSHINDRDLQ